MVVDRRKGDSGTPAGAGSSAVKQVDRAVSRPLKKAAVNKVSWNDAARRGTLGRRGRVNQDESQGKVGKGAAC